MKYLSLLFIAAFLAGCASTPSEPPELLEPPPPPPPPAPVNAEVLFAPPPYLWSSQKMLEQSPDTCANKAVETLKALSFISVVKNGSYVYGTLLANRAAIKCVPNGDGTFVYTAVAGPDVKQVERLRNEIFWRL